MAIDQKRVEVNVSRNSLVVAVVIMFAFVISAVTAVALFVSDPNRTNLVIPTLIAQLPIGFAVISLLIKMDSVDNKTDSMLNGTMDDKMKKAIHAVLDERESNR